MSARQRWKLFSHLLRRHRRNFRLRTDETSWDQTSGERAMAMLRSLPFGRLGRTIG